MERNTIQSEVKFPRDLYCTGITSLDRSFVYMIDHMRG